MLDGKKIKELRKKHGLSREKLAVKVGVSKKTIQRLENEETVDPHLTVVVALAKALLVDIKDIMKD